MGRRVRHVASVGALLGEGPVWDADGGLLRFVDIKGMAAYAFDPASGKLERFAAPGQIGWLLPTDRGDWMAGLKDGLYRFDPDNAAFTFHARIPGEPSTNRLNDACTAPSGQLWLGSMDDAEEAASGRFYRYDRGAIKASGPAGIAITNGPAIAPDGDRIYFADTLGKTIHAAPLYPTGEVGATEPLIRIEDDAGWPDGPTVDSEGCLWTGLYGGWGVRRYSSAGDLLETVTLPVANCTKIAFGGPDLRTAFVTTASKGLSAAELARQPQAGDVFAFDVDVSGCPVTPVATG